MDEPRENSPEAGKPVAGAVEGKGNRIVVIVIIVVALLVNTLIALFLIKATKPESQEEKTAKVRADSLKQATEQATVMGATTADAPIEAIVNIAGTEGERLLKAEIIFEFDDKTFPDLGAELARRSPKFKDMLINHLSRQTLSDLTEPDAKEKIRKDLVRLINATIPPKIGEVREVLFTTYIIQ